MRRTALPDISAEILSARRARLEECLREVAAQLAAGGSVSTSRIKEQNADLMPELDEELRVLELTHRQLLAAQRVENLGTLHPDDSAGVVIPNYRIEETLGTGGQGVVFRATQLSTGRIVAVKVLLGGPLLNRRRQLRLEREVAILASLTHPNIVGVFDHGRTADGSLFLAMDYVNGVHLDQWIASRQSGVMNRGAFVRLTLEMFVKAVGAVGHAHSKNIIHRDLKPSNVRIDRRDEPHLLDFGLARILDADDAGVISPGSITMEGNVVGSIPWLSPEQASGANRIIGAPSDVYALGVMLYEALAGRAPCPQGATLGESLLAIQNLIPAPPSRFAADIPPALDAIVLRALEKRPEDRFANADALRGALEAVLTPRLGLLGETVAVGVPSGLLGKADRHDKPGPRRWARTVVLMTAAAIVTLVLWFAFGLEGGAKSSGGLTATVPSTHVPNDKVQATWSTRLIKLAASDDAYVRDGTFAGIRLGEESVSLTSSFARLEVKKVEEKGFTRDAYFRFPLTTLPKGKTIRKATLWVHGVGVIGRNSAPDTYDSLLISVFPLADPDFVWDEQTVDWNHRPFLSGWQSVDTAICSTRVSCAVAQWHAFELTSLVVSEVEKGRTAVTFGMHVVTSVDVHGMFDSSETERPPTLCIYLAE